MPKMRADNVPAPRRVRGGPLEADRENYLDSFLVEELSYNPGSPIPNLLHTAIRLDELWPLRDAIGGSLQKLHDKQKGRGVVMDPMRTGKTNLLVDGDRYWRTKHHTDGRPKPFVRLDCDDNQ